MAYTPSFRTTIHEGFWLAVILAAALAVCYPAQVQSEDQKGTPKFEVDPTWPKPLPNRWINGQVSGVCADRQDHIFIVNRNDITDEEKENGVQSPPVIEFDPDGNVVNSFGDWKVVPNSPHGCFVDSENNVWMASNGDGIVQKYTHDGKKLLLQIGTRGVVDSSDGKITGRPLNSSHTSLNMPAGVAVDPANGDVYVADGYGNSRVAVFDKNGKFLRQWGHQGNAADAAAGVPDAFMLVVNCVALGNDGLVYVCDRQSDRIQVFDKMGNFKKNIWIKRGDGKYPDVRGTTWWIAFSPDPEQRYMYVADGGDEEIKILDYRTDQILGSFGRRGHQIGEFTHAHTMAVDSKGNLYIAETDWGRRVQRFKLVNGN